MNNPEYKLEYIPGATKGIYYIWEHKNSDFGIERSIVAMMYDARLASQVVDFLNGEYD